MITFIREQLSLILVTVPTTSRSFRSARANINKRVTYIKALGTRVHHECFQVETKRQRRLDLLKSIASLDYCPRFVCVCFMSQSATIRNNTNRNRDRRGKRKNTHQNEAYVATGPCVLNGDLTYGSVVHPLTDSKRRKNESPVTSRGHLSSGAIKNRAGKGEPAQPERVPLRQSLCFPPFFVFGGKLGGLDSMGFWRGMAGGSGGGRGREEAITAKCFLTELPNQGGALRVIKSQYYAPRAIGTGHRRLPWV